MIVETEQAPRMRQQSRAPLSQATATDITLHQHAIEKSFKAFDLLADAALGDMQAPCSSTDAARFRHPDKGPQESEIDSANSGHCRAITNANAGIIDIRYSPSPGRCTLPCLP